MEKIKYMKNPIVIVAIFIVIAFIGFSTFTLSKNSSNTNLMIKENETVMPKNEVAVEPTDVMMKKDEGAGEDDKLMDNKTIGSRYIQYSKTALSSVSGNRRVLFFYASWCPTCRPADENFIKNVSKIPEDVTLIRVNYNDPETDQEEKDLAKKYGITYQHTFVQIDSMGKEITKWNGGQIDELLSYIK